MNYWLAVITHGVYPPVFEDEDKTYITRVLYAAVATSLGGALLLFLQTWLAPANSSNYLAIGSITVAVDLGLLAVIRSGRIHLARWLAISLFWLLATTAIVSAGGVGSASYMVYLTLIVLAALLFGARGGLIMAAINGAMTALFTLAEINGLRSSFQVGWMPVNFLINTGYQFITVTVLQATASLTMQNVLCQARQEIAKRQRAEEQSMAAYQRTEAALRQSEQLLRSIIDTSPDRIFVKDRNYRYFLVNQAFAAHYGRTTTAEIVGKDDYELNTPLYLIEGDPEHNIQGYRIEDQMVIERGETFHNPYDLTTDAAGKECLFETVKLPLRNADGEIFGVLGVARDITERKRTEESLARRAAELQTVAEVSTAASTILETNQLLQRVVDLTRDSFGLYHAHIYLLDETGDTLILAAGAGQVGQQMVAQGWRIPLQAKKSLVARAARSGQGVIVNDVQADPAFMPNPLLPDTRAELAVPLMAGKKLIGVLDVQANQPDYFSAKDLHIQTTLAGQIAIAVENARLFEAQEQVTAALRRSEEQLRAIISNLPLIFFVLDSEGVFTVSEGKGLALLKLEPGEVVGRSVFEVYQDKPEIIGIMRQALAGEISHVIQKSGEIIFEVFYTPLHVDYGQGAGVIGVAIDITERTQAEGEREALIHELEARNAELERFTYTVSHDLKSPLITIGGFLGFLEKDALAGNRERMKADINRIKEAADKMRRLLDDLLELSRVGRLMNPPKNLAFSEIVKEALELVHGRLAERGVSVAVAESLPLVHGDRVRLIEVIQNLVENAVKFMGEQIEPKIEIGVRHQEGEQVFYVKDNGTGIEPRYQQKVFGLFDKLDADSEGTGIGLTLVKRIVEVHGGRIWVESEGAGRGTTFCFTLPVVETI